MASINSVSLQNNPSENKASIARSRLAVGSLFLLHGLCFSTWGARIPAIQHRLGLSDAELGSVLFAMPLGSLLSMPPATWLNGRFGSRKAAAVSISFYGFLLFIVTLVNSAPILAALLFILGFGSNCFNISVNTQAVGVEKRLGRSVIASFHGMWSLAGFFGAAFGGLMIAAGVSPTWHFLIILCVLAIVLPLNARFLVSDETNEKEGQPFFVWPERALVGLGLIAFCSMICEGAMFDWSGVYFRDVIQISPRYIAVGYVAFMSAMASARFYADRLIERHGIGRILKICGSLIATGLLIAVAFPVVIAGVIGFLLVGAGTSAVVPLVFSQAGKTSARSTGSSIAAVSTIGFLGFLIGPPLIGWVAGATSLRVSFSIIAVMGMGITLLASLQFSVRKEIRGRT